MFDNCTMKLEIGFAEGHLVNS